MAYPPPQFTTKPGTQFRRLPTITQAEFKTWASKQPKKPGGRSYEGYRTYLENNRIGRPPAVPKATAPKGGATDYASLLRAVGQFETPAQLEARANRMTQQGITAQTTAIRDEARMMREDAQRRMEAQAAAGRAASAQNAGLFGLVGGEYNSAASEIANLGTNLGASMAGATDADVAAQNAALASINAPGLTVGGPTAGPGLGGAQQQAVEAYRGATIPKQQIDQAGQAAQFGLAGMVTAQNLRATQEAQAGFVEATREVDRNRLAAIKEMQAGRPETAAKFLLALQDAQRQQIGLAQGLVTARNAQRNTNREVAIANKQQVYENKVTDKEMTIKQGEYDYALSEVDVTRSVALGYVVDKKGDPILKNGKKIPASKLLEVTTAKAKGAKGATMTPGQRVELIQKAQDFAETAFYGYGKDDKGKRVPVTQLGNFDPDDPDTYGNGAMNYSTALSRLTQLNINPNAARQILDSYYDRGDQGRPLFSDYEAKVLKKQLGLKKFNWARAQINRLLGQNTDESIASADSLINEVMAGGRNISWAG